MLIVYLRVHVLYIYVCVCIVVDDDAAMLY